MNTLQEKLTGALVGIARATDGNAHLITPEVTALVMEALAACRPDSKVDDKGLEALLERVAQTKREMVPNCFLCDNPCGRTSDFCLAELNSASQEVREEKLRMLSLAQNAAAVGDPETAPLLYDALYLLGMEMDNTDSLNATIAHLNR